MISKPIGGARGEQQAVYKLPASEIRQPAGPMTWTVCLVQPTNPGVEEEHTSFLGEICLATDSTDGMVYLKAC